MDSSPSDASEAINDYLQSTAPLSDDESLDLEELGNGKTDWKSVKARLQTHGRSRFKIQPLENKDMPILLKQWSQQFRTTKQNAFVRHAQEQFVEWHSLLLNGFHLAFYGVGSMKELIEHFLTSEISPKVPSIIINGFYPMMKLDELVNMICVKIIQGFYQSTDLPSTSKARIDYIRTFFSRGNKSLVLVIHSLDELIRLNLPMWTAICEQIAVNGNNVHLVVSVDHHFAPTVIPAALPFIWFPCPTGLPYDLELAYKAHSASATTAVSSKAEAQLDLEKAYQALAALPNRNVLIFCILGNLAQRETTGQNGVHFDLLLEKVLIAETNIDARTLETQVNQLQAYKLVKRNLKLQTMAPNMPNAVLQQVLDHYTELWVLYAEDLM